MNKESKKEQLSRAEQIIHRYFEGKVTPEFVEIVQGWLASGDSEEEIDAALGEIFEDKVVFENKPRQELIDALPELRRKAGYTVQEQVAIKIPLRHRMVFKVAAILIPLIVVGGAALWINRTSYGADSQLAQHTVAVPPDDPTQVIVLPDGSTVRLEAGSKLSYAENFGENRTLELNGEGYFSVVKDESRPFIVKSDAMTVTVLGTEFIMHTVDTDEISLVTLVTGKVKVTAGTKTHTLAPGETLTYNKQHKSIELEELSRGQLLQLRGESMTFKDETLNEIFSTVQGYYGVKIEIGSGVDTGRKIVVGFEGRESLNDVMFILQRITQDGFKYKIDGNIVTITR